MANHRREVESTDYLPNLDAGEQPLSWKDLKLTMVARSVATVGEREFQSSVDMEAFMHEEIVIRIHHSGDKNAPPLVPIGCNGETVWLPRGKAISIPRKFVERLCAYELSYSTETARDPNSNEGMTQRIRASQPYPFAVIREHNPRGRAWLERLMVGG